MNITLSNNLVVTEMPADFRREVMSRLTIQNPEWSELDEYDQPEEIPRYLEYYEETENGLIIPRGFTGKLFAMVKEAGLPCRSYANRRRRLPEAEFPFFRKPLDCWPQALAVTAEHDFVTLSAPPGLDRMAVVCHMIATRLQPTLIVVPAQDMLECWVEEVSSFLKMSQEEIGVIGDGLVRIGKVTVGVIDSLYPIVKEISKYFGYLVVDECESIPVRVFTGIVSVFDSQYMTGLSSGLWRKDGLSKLVGWYLGPEVRVDHGYFDQDDGRFNLEITTRKTDFVPRAHSLQDYSLMLAENESWNRPLVSDILKELGATGGTCVVVTSLRSHSRTLLSMLRAAGVAACGLAWDTPRDARRAILKELKTGKVEVLVALLNQDFDAKHVSALFLATPEKFDRHLLRYMGQILRPGENLTKVYAYAESSREEDWRL